MVVVVVVEVFGDQVSGGSKCPVTVVYSKQ